MFQVHFFFTLHNLLGIIDPLSMVVSVLFLARISTGNEVNDFINRVLAKT